MIPSAEKSASHDPSTTDHACHPPSGNVGSSSSPSSLRPMSSSAPDPDPDLDLVGSAHGRVSRDVDGRSLVTLPSAASRCAALSCFCNVLESSTEGGRCPFSETFSNSMVPSFKQVAISPPSFPPCFSDCRRNRLRAISGQLNLDEVLWSPASGSRHGTMFGAVQCARFFFLFPPS
jgi:hypothetical protein